MKRRTLWAQWEVPVPRASGDDRISVPPVPCPVLVFLASPVPLRESQRHGVGCGGLQPCRHGIGDTHEGCAWRPVVKLPQLRYPGCKIPDSTWTETPPSSESGRGANGCSGCLGRMHLNSWEVAFFLGAPRPPALSPLSEQRTSWIQSADRLSELGRSQRSGWGCPRRMLK